jgi:hydroxyacylglutathione hydrolase
MDKGTMAALVDEGLGNSCYLVDLGDGSALVVDPPRDLRAVRAKAGKAGLRIRFVADTHLHADFLSGAVQLRHDDGAQVLASAAGGRTFEHRGLVDGEEVDLGGLVLAVMATPGHTDEHLAFLLLDDGAPRGVFSGGSLLVGSAARTDLLGPERVEELARAQYASLRRLAALPEHTALWPTHGAGSFCSAPPGADRVSTIGRERATNPLLGIDDEDRFVDELLGSLGSYPPYFLHLAEVNRRGPAIVDTPGAAMLRPLPVAEVHRLDAHGAVVVDVRPITDWAVAHIPGALPIPLRAQFATWLGWLAPAETPLVIVRNAEQDAEEIVWQALKIGYDTVAGELTGGMNAWAAEGQPTRSTEVISADRIGSRRVIDVRQLSEFTGGHLPGATHVELGSIAEAADGLPSGPTVVMCGHGERAAGAASLLERAGHSDLAVLTGGLQDWERATGKHLETGS